VKLAFGPAPEAHQLERVRTIARKALKGPRRPAIGLQREFELASALRTNLISLRQENFRSSEFPIHRLRDVGGTAARKACDRAPTI
jgi:hypothetical protein